MCVFVCAGVCVCMCVRPCLILFHMCVCEFVCVCMFVLSPVGVKAANQLCACVCVF